MKLTLFTDGTSTLITGKNMNELTSNLDTINSIIAWFDKNRLITNKGKSLAFGCHHTLNRNIVFLDIILEDKQITYTSESNFLGVWLNRNLNWDLHAENLTKKLSKLCIAIKTLRPSEKSTENHVFYILSLILEIWHFILEKSKEA